MSYAGPLLSPSLRWDASLPSQQAHVWFTDNQITGWLPKLQWMPHLHADTRAISLMSVSPISAGRYGSVVQAVLQFFSDRGDETHRIPVAVKMPNPRPDIQRYTIAELIKEWLILQRASYAQNIGFRPIFLKWGNNFYLIQQLFAIDGETYINSTLSSALSPDHTRSMLKDLLKGGSVLQRLHVIHNDIKPPNLLLDAAGRLSIGDFGGALYLPPLEELTPEFLRYEYEMMGLNEPSFPEYKTLNPEGQFETATLLDKIFFHLYFQTTGRLEFKGTPCTTNPQIETKINEKFCYFTLCLQSKVHYTETDLTSAYNKLRTFGLKQMVHQLALTSLSLLSQSFYTMSVIEGSSVAPKETQLIKTILEKHFPSLDLYPLFRKMILQQSLYDPNTVYQEFIAAGL